MVEHRAVHGSLSLLASAPRVSRGCRATVERVTPWDGVEAARQRDHGASPDARAARELTPACQEPKNHFQSDLRSSALAGQPSRRRFTSKTQTHEGHGCPPASTRAVDHPLPKGHESGSPAPEGTRQNLCGEPGTNTPGDGVGRSREPGLRNS